MNAQEWHLAINHFPVIGSLWTLALVLGALLKPSKTLLVAGLVSALVVAFLVLAATRSGSLAEEHVHGQPGVSGSAVAAHAQRAQKTLLPTAGTLLAAVASWILLGRGRGVRTAAMPSLLAVVIMTWMLTHTAQTGGKIHRPELRQPPGATTLD